MRKKFKPLPVLFTVFVYKLRHVTFYICLLTAKFHPIRQVLWLVFDTSSGLQTLVEASRGPGFQGPKHALPENHFLPTLLSRSGGNVLRDHVSSMTTLPTEIEFLTEFQVDMIIRSRLNELSSRQCSECK